MRKIQLYKLEQSDPDWQRRIDEAFNRLLNFATELHSAGAKVPHTKCKLFNKVCVNGEFTLEEWIEFHEYGRKVVARATKGAHAHLDGRLTGVDHPSCQ